MKLTKTQLKKFIKEELSKVMAEGDLPKFETIDQEYKDLAREVVQNYLRAGQRGATMMGPDWGRGVEQALANLVQATNPNNRVGKAINKALLKRYPDEIDAMLRSVRLHPFWTQLSWGMQKEATNLYELVKDNPDIAAKAEDGLKRDWVSFAKEHGAIIDKITPFDWAAGRAHPDD